MEIAPTIFCTLDNETDLAIKEVFDLLPSEIKEFHRHISWAENGQTLCETFNEVIQYVQTSRSNNTHSARHIAIGIFHCNFFILFRKVDDKKINDVSNRFKEMFSELVKVGDYEEILFNLSEDKINSHQNYYQLCNLDSHGMRVEDEKLFERLKYFFLFFLTSDLYESEKISYTNNAFYINSTSPQKYFKSISLEVDGLPIFSLRDYYYEILKEKYLRELLKKQQELDDEAVLNKIKIVSSLKVENFKSSEKPKNPLELSFFSTKKGRKENIENAIKNASKSFNDYETSCNNNAKQQRVNLETDVKSKKPNELRIIINEIIASSKSITELIKLIDKLSEKNGKIYELLKTKENEIKWPKIFHFTKEKFTSNHPNWLIFSILGCLFILPEVIDYIIYFPTEYLIKWNVLFGLIWGGYTLYSVFNIRRVRSSFNKFYFTNLQSIETYFSDSFAAFRKYLELHIIKIFLRSLTSIKETLIKNQAFFVAYYLTSFKSSQHHKDIMNIYSEYLKLKPTYSDLFIDRLNKELLKLLNSKEKMKESIGRVSEIKEQSQRTLEIIKIIENDKSNTRLEMLTEKLKSEEVGKRVIEITQSEVDKYNFNFDSTMFVEKINLNQLESKINEFISHQNFDTLLSKIKQQLDFSPEELIKKLLNKDHLMYYLSPSQDKIEEKKMIFTPDLLRREDIIEYNNELKVICGYLKIGDFKVNNSEEAK